MSTKKDDAPNAGCKRTIRENLGTVRVADGQHLHYFVTVAGSKPVFSLACRHKTHFNADELGLPKKNYDVVWLRSAADEEPAQDGESYAFSMAFVAALKYTLRVELHAGNHALVGAGLIVDADYESNNPLASCNETFVVRTKPKEGQ